MSRVASEIPLPRDAAVILALGSVEFDADPFAGGEGGCADEADGGGEAVGEGDSLAGTRGLGGGGHGGWKWCAWRVMVCALLVFGCAESTFDNERGGRLLFVGSAP